ncbi:DNA-binding protein, partial [Carbonactinospora thermoautotrophica]
MVEVRRVLDAIGATLLTVVRAGADRAVRDVVIVEPGHEDEIRAGDLVLGVGVTVHAARELVAVAARSRAAAVLLKPPYATEPAVTKAAETGGVTLVEVRQQVSWAQLVWLLRSVLDAGDVYHTRDTGVFHDLFALADAVAAVVDAPVTIEDAHSRVLAYSARQDRADPARLSTIIGRRVPDDVLHQFRAKGVFRKLGKGTEPVFVPGQPDGTLPRLIVPIRAGEELLGSIWA